MARAKDINNELLLDYLQYMLSDSRLSKKWSTNMHTTITDEHTLLILFIVHGISNEPLYKWQQTIVEMLDCYVSNEEKGSISIGRVYPDAEGILNSDLEAVESYALGSIVWKNKRCFSYPVLSVYNTLKKIDLSYVDMNYVSLLEKDSEMLGFDCITCLEMYLECGFKVAAQRLFLHVNTLRYRIQKISDLLQINLQDRLICNALLLQIKLWRLNNCL